MRARAFATLGEALPDLACLLAEAAERERRRLAAAQFDGELRASELDATSRRFARERSRSFRVGRAHAWIPDPVSFEILDPLLLRNREG